MRRQLSKQNKFSFFLHRRSLQLHCFVRERSEISLVDFLIAQNYWMHQKILSCAKQLQLRFTLAEYNPFTISSNCTTFIKNLSNLQLRYRTDRSVHREPLSASPVELNEGYSKTDVQRVGEVSNREEFDRRSCFFYTVVKLCFPFTCVRAEVFFCPVMRTNVHAMGTLGCCEGTGPARGQRRRRMRHRSNKLLHSTEPCDMELLRTIQSHHGPM